MQGSDMGEWRLWVAVTLTVAMAMLAAMSNNADIKHVVVVDEDIDIVGMVDMGMG